MTESEKKEMIETVLERTGAEMDIPLYNSIWQMISEDDVLEEFVQKLSETLILKTAQYLQPQNEVWT